MQVLIEHAELEWPRVINWERGMTDDEYYQFCTINPDLRIERTAEGDIVIMPPAGDESSFRNARLAVKLGIWTEEDGRGRAFDATAAFILPSGAARSPDASWILRSRLTAVTRGQRRRFIKLCPDFVVELMSPSDRLKRAKAKMQEWMENGAQLGWLIDADHRTVYIYRPGQEPEKVVDAQRVIGEGPVAGFVLELAGVWEELV